MHSTGSCYYHACIGVISLITAQDVMCDEALIDGFSPRHLVSLAGSGLAAELPPPPSLAVAGAQHD
jgi:hypothetical protein